MKKIAFLIGVLSCSTVFAAPGNTFWQDIPQSARPASLTEPKANEGLIRRKLTLDESSFEALLIKKNQTLGRPASAAEQLTEINLPLPDGKFVRVKVYESPIISSTLAEKHPEIHTWQVVGVDDPALTGRIDFTALGFHGMLTMPDGDIVYIDPDKNSQQGIYYSLSKKQNKSHFKTDFNCQVHDEHNLLGQIDGLSLSGKKLAQVPGQSIKTYRVAVAGTAEYTNFFGGPANAVSAMITTINRVNQIYQRDLAVKLTVVSDDSLFYTDAANDPYTNGDAVALVGENITNLNAVIGPGAYDIGHVFAKGSLGGLAYVGAVCQNSYKAGGATGISNPQGEIFSIEYVAHEMGHQFGATHTFNSTQGSCGNSNRTADSAVEPGSGSTIMSYSGLCGSDNIQTTSDAMFHWKSISQIKTYTSGGGSCGSAGGSIGSSPAANAGGNGTILINTPFVLEGSGSGGSYSWDQTDAGSASTVNTDTGNNAIIRALLPTSNPVRYIPRLSNLFAGTATIGERLPQTVRSLNFTLVSRGGDGALATSSKTLAVKDTGSVFRVLSQNTNQTLSKGQTVDVVWNVAGTDTAPVSCANVDIELLRVTGIKNTLLLNTTNDGSESVTIPTDTPTMSNARIMVSCSNQPFFQISSGNITIQNAVIDTTPPVITLNGANSISLLQGVAYVDAGATAVDNIDGNVAVTSSGTVNTAVSGTYTITYTATDGAGNTATATRTVEVTPYVDVVAPVISLLGATVVEVEQGATYSDAGATAIDNIDGVVAVTRSGTVDTAVLGSYIITYTASDAAGNTSTKTRTVNVVEVVLPDTQAPVITLQGVNPVSVEKGSNYIEPGATAIDDRDGMVDVTISGTVNTSQIGDYIITYTATDAAGNTQVTTRTVSVTTAPDTTPPVIKLSGDVNVTIVAGETFVDPGYDAFDDRDGIVSVVVTGSVDTKTPGTYVLTYTAKDSAGNTFVKKRTVIVEKAPDNPPADGSDGEHGGTKASGGGSIGLLLLPLAMLGLRKRRFMLSPLK